MMVDQLIKPLERIILHGGQEVIQFPRSTGKTTWTKIAVIWAIVYGHKRFVMTVAATRELSDGMADEIIGSFADQDMEGLAVDFPGVSLPIRACEANAKKARSVYVNGFSAGMRWKGSRFQFPSVRDKSGNTIEPSAGAVLVSGSIGGAIKGALNKRERPDFIILDDPQTRKIAESASETSKTERFIDGDVMGLRAQTSVYSVVMTITPIRIGDVASRYTNHKLHPEFFVSTAKYCTVWKDRHEELLAGFRQCYIDDNDTGDCEWHLSRRFYLDHKEEFADVRVIDDRNFNANEIDAIHHLLVLKTTMRSFEAEYQMNVAEETGETALSADEIMTNLSGVPRGVLPPGTFDVVVFCDVNTAAGAGLRWGALAVGPNALASFIDYGQFPTDGSALVPPKTPPQMRDRFIQDGIKAVTATIINKEFRFQSGQRVRPSALCFDGGYAMDAVNNVVNWIGANVKLHGMDIMWSLGRGWEAFDSMKRNEREFIRADHVKSAVVIDKRMLRAADGRVREVDVAKKFLCIHSDYWREAMQKAFFRRSPAPGSCSMFGTDPHAHRIWADEVTYERLVRTYRDERTRKAAWEWDNQRKGHNHYGDVAYGCFAVAAWKKLYAIPRDGFTRVEGQVQAKWLTEAPAAQVKRQAAPKKTLFRKLQRPRFVK